ncbi:Ferredoxin [Methanonatronarchaeum thermophilum]|uniref:Ferredoxin n=1 Tax=Methanonatronarchaeum thermophilum TaxID=1927129 RepID=A0A1Y3GE69_9EURY|nr:4Fe-4S binding protein [Methanonatronarchaeum thermophilum]OUJ19540.1 Ferredoxin [Methanonatronarchaeum thermophilum]
MVKRDVIEIDREICDGCGECIPACPEGAIQVIDGKAMLVNEAFCDGLGACIGDCPKNAIEITEKDVEPYNEEEVVEKMVQQGPNVLKTHLQHLSDHGQQELLETAVNHLKELGIEPPIEFEANEIEKTSHSCPGAQIQTDDKKTVGDEEYRLNQWPIQLTLVPVKAPYFQTEELVFIADCVTPTYPDIHQIIRGRPLVMGCPKLDERDSYINKLTKILEQNPIEKITNIHMEVPCCYGTKQIIEKAIEKIDREIQTKEIIITVDGEIEQNTTDNRPKKRGY